MNVREPMLCRRVGFFLQRIKISFVCIKIGFLTVQTSCHLAVYAVYKPLLMLLFSLKKKGGGGGDDVAYNTHTHARAVT